MPHSPLITIVRDGFFSFKIDIAIEIWLIIACLAKMGFSIARSFSLYSDEIGISAVLLFRPFVGGTSRFNIYDQRR